MDTIEDIVVNVKNRKYDFIKYSVYNQTHIDEKTFITIVMTTHNRKEQTLYTLHSFENSTFPQINVIIVDDSTDDQITPSEFKQFPFQITYITIENLKKKWINPCVNYNIGFNEVKTDRVIIQNAEVCHCGDIIKYVADNVDNRSYLVFDVCAIPSLEGNHEFYQLNDTDNSPVFLKPFFSERGIWGASPQWYQHQTFNRNYHFLCAMTKDNLIKLDGFDYDFALGSCYDDDELIFRIQNVLKLNVLNIFNEETRLLGIHQWHPQGALTYSPHHMQINLHLCESKKDQFYRSGTWFLAGEFNKN